MSPLRRTATLALAAAALGFGAAPAAADSIAYVKGGDVWLASPDGARQQQVTRTGGYAAVSQADTGVMIALAGERLHRLSRTGQVLADFPTMVSDGLPQAGPVNRFHGPFAPEISPDGTKVAYEWINDAYDTAPGCSDTSVPPCRVFTQRQGVAISHADRYTGPEAFGLLTGWIFPQWLGEDTLVRSFSGTILTDDAVLTRVGPGKGDAELDPWFFDDDQGFGVDDVELSRDLSTVVGIAGQDDERLRVYRTTVAPSGAPDWNHQPFFKGNVPVAQRCGELTGPVGGRFATPSLSPDGRGLAWAEGDGIHVASLPDACGPVQGARLLVAGARHADWGPAPIPPASAYAPPVPVGPTPPVKVVGPVVPPDAPRAALSVRRVKLGAALRRGLRVGATGVPAGTPLTARAGRRVVARGRVRTGLTVLRFAQAERRRLGRARRLTLVLRAGDARLVVRLTR